MGHLDDPRTEPEAEPHEGLRVEFVVHEGGHIHVAIEARGDYLEDLRPRLAEMLRDALSPSTRTAFFEKLVGLVVNVSAGDTAQLAGLRLNEHEFDMAEDDSAFEKDLDYVLDKNAELYKRLAR